MSKWKGLNLQAGMLTSTLEHAVPEQLFNTDPANPIDGISAIKALQLVAQQGQKIYQITPQNQATVLPQLTLSALAMKEIRQGLAAGKEVITHASQVSVPGFTGEGYIITDPVTGSGAYKISGGSNGGFMGFAIAFIMVAAVFFVTTGWVAILVGILAFIAHISVTLQLMDDPDESANYAATRFLTLFFTTALILILDQIVFFAFPPLFILALILATLAALISILNVIFFALNLSPRGTTKNEILSV